MRVSVRVRGRERRRFIFFVGVRGWVVVFLLLMLLCGEAGLLKLFMYY